MRRAGGLACGLLLGVALGCQPVGERTRNVVVTGSDEMAPLVGEVGRRFEAAHPGVRIDVQARGSALGVKDVRDGLADVGMVARAPRPEEASLRAFPIARDGLCLIVNKDNPVSSLTDDQVVRLYTRAVTNWGLVGGKDGPVLLVSQGEGDALLDVFLDTFRLRSALVKGDVVVNGSAAAIRAVAGRPNAISYAGIGVTEADGSVRALPRGGVAPTLANLRDGSYALSRPLDLVTRDEPQGPAREFIDFARSAAVADLVEKYHLIPPE